MSASERDSVELESQLILRLPEAPAAELREALRNGATNLKDRLRLKLETDLRHGTLFFDHYVLPCKLVDLPCVIESQKTIDKKNIYKTADICQMILCMEEEEPEEEAKPQKKSSNLKVDKKYLFPHGVTPPLKCVRKRRFRRTLKKKQYSDQPEIEKEVRRLLRTDYEAYHISWECIDDEQEEKGREGGTNKDAILMQGSKTNDEPGPASDRLAELQIFGEELSDSDADDDDAMGGDMDDESRISMDLDDSQSRQSDSMASLSQPHNESSKSSLSFQDMFATPSSSSIPSGTIPSKPSSSTPSQRQGTTPTPLGNTAELLSQLNELKNQLAEINSRRQAQETDLASMEPNHVLKRRLETHLNILISDQAEKDRQIREVEALLNQN